MRHRIAFCAGLSALAVAAAGSAQAQVYGAPPPDAYDEPPAVIERRPLIGPIFQPRLPPSEALMIVRASGLRPLTRPAVRGSHYVLLASDNMGGQLRVVVNGNNGRIMNASPAYDPRFAYEPVRPRGLVPMPAPQQAAAPPPAQGAAPPPDLREPSPPLPRTARATPPQTPAAAAGQDHRLAAAPEGANAAPPARPERTPLPRPRPQIASTKTTASTTPAATPAAAPQAARETSPESETTPAANPAPAPAAPSAAPAQPTQPTETQLIPVAPLD